MKKLFTILLVAGLAFSLTQSVEASSQRLLQTIINDYATGAGLVGVKVEFRQNGQLFFTQYTIQGGQTPVIPLNVGQTYLISLSKPGYTSYSTTFSIPAGVGPFVEGPFALSSTANPSQPLLSVSKSGGTGSFGIVTATSPSGGINCGADCSQSYPLNTAVT
ncbi:MAG: hypothetical protein AAB453_02710, partial [Patescibacteria group bacterium]